MAKAELGKRIITPAVAEVSEETVVLTMNKEEANLLRKILGEGIRGISEHHPAYVLFKALYEVTSYTHKMPFTGVLSFN